MERTRRVLFTTAALAAALALLAGCTGTKTRAERLALYQTNAGAPVDKIRYFSPISWDEVDDDHIVVTMRPTEQYLMRLSGPCLDFDTGSPVLAISSQAGYVSAKFDRVTIGNSGMSCRIDEIRPIDVRAMRAAQASGT